MSKQSVKEMLRQHGITHNAVLKAINKALSPTMTVDHAIRLYGLCHCFRDSNAGVYEAMDDLGADRGDSAYYWPAPTGDMNKAARQRLMMLAFLLEWTR